MSEWKEYKLGEIINVKHGYAFKGEYFSDTPTLDILLTPGNFNIGGGFKKGKLKYYNGEYPISYILNEGDIIVTMTDLSKEGDTLGYSAKIPKHNEIRYLHNQRIGLLQFTNEDFCKDYIYWVLRSRDYQKFIVNSATGSTVKHTSPSRISEYVFSAPDLPTQTAIAEILSSLDDKIELNNKINQELETLAQTLFKQWFIDFEFPNENGKPYKSSGGEMVLSEFGEIPKDWEIGKIGDYIKFIKGKKPLEVFHTESENTLPQILIETLDTGKSMFAKPEKMTICEKEDLIMVMDGASSGRIEIGFRGILGSTLAIIKSNGINNNLLYQFLKFKEQDIRNNTTGAAIPHTDKSKIYEYTISLPTENIASNFSSIQENITNMIFSNKSELKSLTHLRDTLLPKLITGELDINEINNN